MTDLKTQITALQRADKRITQAQIAREAGVSAATVSLWMKGTYAGDSAEVERKLQRWLDSYQERQQHASHMPAAPGFQLTPTAEKVLAALRYAQLAQDMAVVYGGAGLGKTTAIVEYSHSMPNVWHATMTPAQASVVTALQEIAEAVGAGTSGGASALHKGICKAVSRSEGLLVIDEAQHLGVAALDQIRSIHDATGIGIALVGNEQVFARMTGGNRASYLDRLFSRIGRKLGLRHALKADVQMLINAWGVEDRAAHTQLQQIAQRPGALRGVNKVLRLAATFAASRDERVTADDVRAAWAELGGAE